MNTRRPGSTIRAFLVSVLSRAPAPSVMYQAQMSGPAMAVTIAAGARNTP